MQERLQFFQNNECTTELKSSQFCRQAEHLHEQAHDEPTS